MNLSNVIGLGISVAIVLGATWGATHSFAIFIDPHAMLIVVGGTMAASMVCFSIKRVLNLTKVFMKRVLGINKKDYISIIQQIVQVSQASRKGRKSLEAVVGQISDPFLKDAVEVLFWLEADVTPEEMRELLECRVQTHFERYHEEAEIFRVMSKFPPAFGLMGTSIGMISLLQSLGKADSKDQLGPSMAVALVATLYGIIMANFIFIPIAENLTAQTREDLISRRMVVEGIMLIAANRPTSFVEEKVKSFLLPSERGDAGPGSSRKAAA
jgi:chemotaxis protein MotA